MKKLIAVILTFAFLLSATAANIFYVKTDGNDASDGMSWATAFKNVQKAIDVASAVATNENPAQIWIAKGTYCTETNTAFIVKNNLAIYGGFAGTETNLDERVAGNETILAAKAQDRTYLIHHSGSITNLSLDLLTFKGAHLDGVRFNDTTATLTNCTITSNNCKAFNIVNSPLTLVNCTINNNNMAGFSLNKSSPTLINCTITANNGDAIENVNYSKPNLINCTITGNKGNGISNKNSSTTLVNSIVWGNNKDELYNGDDVSSFVVSYSIIECGYAGEGNISINPNLGELSNNGGFVNTIPVVTGSSAIAAGITGGNIPTVDARNIARSSTPTVGAYEYSSAHITLAQIETKSSILLYGDTDEITIITDGEPTECILYRDGVEFARSSSNVFQIPVTEFGIFVYSAGVVSGDKEIKTESVTTYYLAQRVVFVSTSGSSENSGFTWGNALNDVQEAIDLASKLATSENPMQVWIAKGTYLNAGGSGSTNSIVLKDNVEVYGGFAGTEKKLTERIRGNETILTTNGDYVVYNNYNLSKLTNTAKLDNVTITGAAYTGIYNFYYSSPTITNCTITANGKYGIYNNYYSSPAITNCTFTNNDVDGMYNEEHSSPVITNCTFTDNSNNGIENDWKVEAYLLNCTISANGGTGVYNSYYATPVIINSIIWGNTGTEIYNWTSSVYKADPSVSYCVVKGGYSGGTNIINSDPMLGELGNYGGFVQTIPVAENSSAIDAGTSGENVPATDARGIVRANTPTIGAYEFSLLSIATQPANIEVYSGKDVTLTIEATGGNLTYQWYKNGVAIEGATSATLSLSNLTSADNGAKYHCVVSNDSGSIASESTIVRVHESASVIYVSKTGSNTGGMSWASALSDLQTAIDFASEIATKESKTIQIWIAKGTYFNESNKAFSLKNNLALYGGFAGTETNLSERVAGNETILTVKSKDRNYVVHYSEKITNLSLDLLTITGAHYDGVRFNDATATLTNCTITGNQCKGFNVVNSPLSLINCTLENNGMAAMALSNSSPILINCTIASNNSDAIENVNNSSPTLINCTVASNKGYGVNNKISSSTTLINSIVWGNTKDELFNGDDVSSFAATYCVIEGGYEGEGNVSANPNFGEFANNGGFVKTISVLEGSSAIFGATMEEETPIVDARGVRRSSKPTIGAYEFGSRTLYDTWVDESGLVGNDAKPRAIPFYDGITNLEKYAFGLDATKATSYTENSSINCMRGEGNAVFEYLVNKNATDVIVKALVSEDLKTWKEATATKSAENGNFDVYKLSTPIPDSGKIFFKLNVSQ